MLGYLKYTQNTMLLLVLGFISAADAAEKIKTAFNQDVEINSTLNGAHVVNLGENLTNKSKAETAQVIQRINYVGMGGQSHLLLSQPLSNQQKSHKPQTIPKRHQLSAQLKLTETAGQFVLPEMDFGVGLVVLEWQQVEQNTSHKFTSTWLMNPNAGQQFADKRSQTLSIRPMLNSQFLTIGNDLPVRLYYQMDGVSEILYAKNHTTGEVTKVTSDAVGMAAVKLNHAGLWTLMVERQEADKKYTSFLNFNVKNLAVNSAIKNEGAVQ